MIWNLPVLIVLSNLFLLGGPFILPYPKTLMHVMDTGVDMPGDDCLHRLVKIQGFSGQKAVAAAKDFRMSGTCKAADAGALILGKVLQQDAPKQAVSWFEKAIKSPSRVIRLHGSLGLAGALAGIGKDARARRILEHLGSKHLSVKDQALVLFLESKVRPQQRKALLRRLFIDFPTSKWAQANRTGVHESDLSNDELFERAEGFSRVFDHGEAARIYKRLHGLGYRPVETAWRLARILLFKLRTRPREALNLLKEVEAARGDSRDLLMARAKAYKMLEEYDRAAQIYHTVIQRYRHGRIRAKCYYYLGWLPYDHGKYNQAIPWFDTFLRRYHHSPLRTYILWFKAWSLIKLGRLADADRTLQRMIPYGNNLVAGKAMYWLGVTAHELHDFDASRQWFKRLIDKYPMTYYSILAWRRLGQWYKIQGPKWLDAPGITGPFVPYWGLDRLSGRYRDVILRVRALAILGFRQAAFRTYRRYRHRIERRFRGRDAVRFLRTVYGATGQWRALSETAARRFRNRLGPVPSGKTLDYWSLVYPQAESWFVRPYARKEGIDPLWVYSIMRQESHFSLSKVSVADAIGIMQMIPETAKRVGKELGLAYDPMEFFRPEINIRFCIHYLASLFRDFKGQVVFASAAYNGGAPPIRRMMLAHRNAPMDRMVEDISYNQSRNYCRKVAEHMLRYIRIYAGPKRRRSLLKALYPDPVDYKLGRHVNY